MQRYQVKNVLPGLKTWDMFGCAPELTYKGQSTFTTYPGAIVSIIIYGLMVLNAIQLTIAYNDGSKQD